MRNDLLDLKNIGEQSSRWLLDIGIESKQQIEELGAVEVYCRLRERYPISKNMLWALQGALMNLCYNQLPEVVKATLLDELATREAL